MANKYHRQGFKTGLLVKAGEAFNIINGKQISQTGF